MPPEITCVNALGPVGGGGDAGAGASPGLVKICVAPLDEALAGVEDGVDGDHAAMGCFTSERGACSKLEAGKPWLPGGEDVRLASFFTVSAPPKMPVKLSSFLVLTGSAGENNLSKLLGACAMGACAAAFGAGALNSLVNAPESFAATAGGGVDEITGAELNIAVNSPGAEFGAGSGAEELSRSGKLKMLANSSGDADFKPGDASAAAGGCGGACEPESTGVPKS
jgi:hypothetical protein